MSSLLPAIENGDILRSPMRRIGGTQVKPLIVADPVYKLTTWCMNYASIKWDVSTNSYEKNK